MELDTIIMACGPAQKTVDLFATAKALVARSTSEGASSTPQPLRTFATPWAAFNLNRKPDIPLSINSTAEMFKLQDLRPALLDFFSNHLQNPSIHHIGGCQRAWANIQLPFNDVMVWYSLRMQVQSMDDGLIIDPQRLNVMPPSDSWPLGQYDTALFVDDSTNFTASPDVGLDGRFFRCMFAPDDS